MSLSYVSDLYSMKTESLKAQRECSKENLPGLKLSKGSFEWSPSNIKLEVNDSDSPLFNNRVIQDEDNKNFRPHLKSYDAVQNRNDESFKHFQNQCYFKAEDNLKLIPSPTDYLVCIKQEPNDNEEELCNTAFAKSCQFQNCPEDSQWVLSDENKNVSSTAQPEYEVHIRMKVEIDDGEMVNNSVSEFVDNHPNSRDDFSGSSQPTVLGDSSKDNSQVSRLQTRSYLSVLSQNMSSQCTADDLDCCDLISNVKHCQCDMCRKQSKSRNTLRRRCSYSLERAHSCNVCKMLLKTKATLKKHLLIHSEEKPHSCEECGKAFRSQRHLSIHRTFRHSDERPHDCDECGKSFKTRSNLQHHVVIHSEERPHCCDLCKKTFKTKTRLTEHLIVHSDKRPFVCDRCGDGFKRKNALLKHLVHRHSKERVHSCDRCGKSFKSRDCLRSHSRSHSAIVR